MRCKQSSHYLLPTWYNWPKARMVNCAHTGSHALKPGSNSQKKRCTLMHVKDMKTYALPGVSYNSLTW